MSDFSKANQYIDEFKGTAYLHGLDVLDKVGDLACTFGKNALVVRDKFPDADGYIAVIRQSLESSGIKILAEMRGAAPNAPIEDLARITAEVNAKKPEILVSFGGGSTIDAVKAADILYTLGGSIDGYFGTGLVTHALAVTGKKLLPHIAIQTAASSSAHLTKYSNITDIKTCQKKLVVDDAIIPNRSVFDYKITLGTPRSLAADGALDGISHALEVLYSSVGKPIYEKILPISLEAIRLVVTYLPEALANPSDLKCRHALGLATDLGGYSIMLGGTNGAHLTSFSLVDILSHGRACGMLNPYYTVFFATSVQDALRNVAEIYYHAGYMDENPIHLRGRELGLATAQAMIAFEKRIGFPTRLIDVPGFTDEHIERALQAAKSPQLKMKLENMPVPMSAEMVDEYMAPILQAAKTGDLGLIKNIS